MAKYDPLFELLCRAGDGPVEMSFDEIDALVGGLPASAGRQRAWWANELHADATRHVHARAWLNAERTVERVDLAGRWVVFSAARWNRGS